MNVSLASCAKLLYWFLSLRFETILGAFKNSSILSLRSELIFNVSLAYDSKILLWIFDEDCFICLLCEIVCLLFGGYFLAASRNPS